MRPTRKLACIGLSIALASLALSAPAAADGPVPPVRAATPPRALPIARGPVASAYAPDFGSLVAHAVGAANDLTVASQRAGQVAAEEREVAAQLALAKATPPAAALPPEIRDAVGAEGARAALAQRLDALAAEESTLETTAAFRLRAADASTLRWLAPARGEITQAFGPTDVPVEPARTVDGVYYAHYHDGLDIGTPMYAPVTAAAPGQVVFVGHLADGAEIVLIAHVGGWVSEYGHLDDRAAPPAVAAGDVVTTGQVIGHVGVTGNTSGPHLHFEVWRNGYLVDPMALLLRALPAPAAPDPGVDPPTRN